MFKIAFRNIFRQKRRTILTMLTMVGGFVLSAISIGYSDGFYSDVIERFTRSQMGHIQVHKGNYLERPSLYKTIESYESVGDTISQLDRVVDWAPRLYSAGLASVGEKSAGVKVIGVDPVRDSSATGFHTKIAQGAMLSVAPAQQVLLGRGLSNILQAEIGDSAVVVSQAADGSIANEIYRIQGIVESGNQAQDRMAFYLHLQEAQQLYVLPNQVHEILVIADGINNLSELTQRIDEQLSNDELTVSPWMEVAKSFYQAMQADKQGMWIMLFVIILIVAIGVLNTVLMSVLERTREYGALKAMGTRPLEIFRMVVFEVAILAIFSIILGSIFGSAMNYILSIYGISIGETVTMGGIEFSKMFTEVNLRTIIIPGVTVLFTAILVSIFPAIKAARIEPAKAMRMH
ncbi:MAG: FtsX-like permease family protein [Candidatus Marinimicrobia bacterium]|nr:FtsX-like permease family protein [Candidatus Neomarinimicrobiota bacterium]